MYPKNRFRKNVIIMKWTQKIKLGRRVICVKMHISKHAFKKATKFALLLLYYSCLSQEMPFYDTFLQKRYFEFAIASIKLFEHIFLSRSIVGVIIYCNYNLLQWKVFAQVKMASLVKNVFTLPNKTFVGLLNSIWLVLLL